MKSKRTFWFLVVGGVVILAVGAYLVVGKSADKVTYRFEKVDRGNVEVTISATGTLSADTTVQVGSQVSGTISRLYADFNTIVKRGQLLAQLDPTSLQASVNDMKAQMDKAQATLNDAERTLRRTKDLFAKKLVSQSDYDAALTAEETSKAGLESAKAQYDRAVINLKYATITSPISGVVISRNVDVGQTVAASLQAPTLYSIANDLRKMQVQAAIDEADIGSVRQGQKVTFHVDAYPDENFEGVVSQVRLQPTITQNVVNYTVIIDVANPSLRLMPGMTATVSILVNKADNVIRVPILATRFVPPGMEQTFMEGTASGDNPAHRRMDDSTSDHQGTPGRGGNGGHGGEHAPGQRVRQGGSPSAVNPIAQPPVEVKVAPARVWVLRNGKPTPLSVERGLQNGRYVEIVRGDLKPGEEVIVGASGQQNGGNGGANPFGPQRMGGPRGRF